MIGFHILASPSLPFPPALSLTHSISIAIIQTGAIFIEEKTIKMKERRRCE